MASALGGFGRSPEGKGKGILLAITDSTHKYIYLYLWGTAEVAQG